MLLTLYSGPDDHFGSEECRKEQPRKFSLEGLFGAVNIRPSSLPYTPLYFLLNCKPLQNCVQNVSTERASFLLCCIPNLFSLGRLATYQKGRPCALQGRHKDTVKRAEWLVVGLLDQLANVV